MRVWFLKETKSVCTSCATGCNITIGSREGVVHRYEPRENDAVNGPWMCDAGRLNYRWIGSDARLREVWVGDKASTWDEANREVRTRLAKATPGSVAIIASARQTTEELYLLKKLATRLGAITDSISREGDPDKLLVNADRSPNANGARLTGIAFTEMGIQIPKIAAGIASGAIKTLIVFGEDVTQHGIGADLLGRLETLIVSNILPDATTQAAHVLLPGCAHAEKRGTFVNAKGRLQKFMKAVEAPGDARPEWEFLHDWVHAVSGQNGFSSIEGLFNQMAREIPAFQGIEWSRVGDLGVTVKI
jgi:NADH-quinone oxidoreductase subunit G